MNILAVQGSPRPRMSNTERLLREFLRGAEDEGAATETVYLKEKEIHQCQGCYIAGRRPRGSASIRMTCRSLLKR